MLLQITFYTDIPEKYMDEYFHHLDEHYMPALTQAKGLVLCQRFQHWDLPQKVLIEIWENKEAELAFDNSEAAQGAWRQFAGRISMPLCSEYTSGKHTVLHRHYTLDKSFKSPLEG